MLHSVSGEKQTFYNKYKVDTQKKRRLERENTRNRKQTDQNKLKTRQGR